MLWYIVIAIVFFLLGMKIEGNNQFKRGIEVGKQNSQQLISQLAQSNRDMTEEVYGPIAY